ncbi:lactonase family protein [Vibrio parahaemolyticus]|uniref:lactonase family protein n=1 Tax=Vibrio mediterranei TaxID=689 RepID=UPI00406819A0
MTLQDYQLSIGQYSQDNDRGFLFSGLSTDSRFQISAKVTDITNPSYLTRSALGHYIVSEQSQHQGAALYFLPENSCDYQVKLLDGDYPCHVSLSDCQTILGVAHYGSGNFELFAVEEHGIIGERLAILSNQGHGAHPTRQEAPHGHQLQFLPDSKQFVSVDLGIDTLTFYCIDTDGITVQQTLKLPSGCGPRHSVFTGDGQFGFVLCELDETLLVIEKVSSGWSLVHSTAAFPEHPSHEAAAAIKLSPDERFVYLSGRGESIVTWFDVSRPVQPRYCGYVPSGGEFPRDLCLTRDNRWLITANQHSGNLALFSLDPITGKPEQVSVSDTITAPVCVIAN